MTLLSLKKIEEMSKPITDMVPIYCASHNFNVNYCTRASCHVCIEIVDPKIKKICHDLFILMSLKTNAIMVQSV